jgi:hypothetical protein
VGAWDPSQEPAPPEGPDLDWSVHPIFARQEPEPWSLTDMPLDTLGRAVRAGLEGDPDRVRRFFGELREEFDEVRGTRMEGEYARALPAFEPHLPPDLWQLFFGDIDPTPVDLAVTSIVMSPPGPAAGGSVTFSAEIANQGVDAAAPFAARLRVDGKTLGLRSVPGLPPGGSATVEFPSWTAVAGKHRVRATADASRQIAEPDERDNTLRRWLVVTKKPRGLPDLVASDLDVVPCDPRKGQEVRFVARVRNAGGNALDAFAVRFDVDGTSVGTATVAGLPAGRATPVRSPRWTAVAGRHTVTLVVDSPSSVDESDEANNTLAERFRVEGRHKRPHH